MIDSSLHDITTELSEAPRCVAEYTPELSFALPSVPWMQNAGLEREGRHTVLLLSMMFTDDIVGLAVGFLWTHSRPM